MSTNPERSRKDAIERFGNFTTRAQAIGATACALFGFVPGAVVLGAGAALDAAGNNLYRNFRDRTRRKLGGVATKSQFTRAA